MRFILDLFRSRQYGRSLLNEPFTPDQRAWRAGWPAMLDESARLRPRGCAFAGGDRRPLLGWSVAVMAPST